jgi:cobalt-zinc-cadmium efflux system protein
VNGVTALLFLRNKDNDLNIKSAYLHLLSDAFVSLGIVIGGVVIYYTQWYWLDSALSIVIALVILFSSWSLLKSSLRLSFDGVPETIHIAEIKTELLKTNGVKDIHHIHVWAISTTQKTH